MNWNAVAAVAELLGAAGVIASLLYLAREMRSSAAQRSLMSVQAVLTKMHELSIGALAGNAQLNGVWVRGSGGMAHLRNQEEAMQFSALCQSTFRTYEELVEYWKAGWVDGWAWESVQLYFVPV